MKLEFNGNQDLIRSVEEGSRLLLSEKKQDETAAMTFSLEKVPEDAGSSIVKKGDTCTVRFQEPAQYFRLFNYALHHNNEDFSLEESLILPDGDLCWTVPEMLWLILKNSDPGPQAGKNGHESAFPLYGRYL